MANGRLAIYPGSFDPITNGHLDVIRRARRLFDEVLVAVGVNSDKRSLLSLEERVDLVRTCTKDLDGIRVEHFEGLVVAFARERGAVTLIRGIRQSGDLDYEMRMFFANSRMQPDLDTVFFAPSEDHALVSASIVREIHRWGGDISSFVPEPVARALRTRANSR